MEFGKWGRGENDDGSDAINDLWLRSYLVSFSFQIFLKTELGAVIINDRGFIRIINPTWVFFPGKGLSRTSLSPFPNGDTFSLFFQFSFLSLSGNPNVIADLGFQIFLIFGVWHCHSSAALASTTSDKIMSK